jgi:hypothetical protein
MEFARQLDITKGAGVLAAGEGGGGNETATSESGSKGRKVGGELLLVLGLFVSIFVSWA